MPSLGGELSKPCKAHYEDWLIDRWSCQESAELDPIRLASIRHDLEIFLQPSPVSCRGHPGNGLAQVRKIQKSNQQIQS